MLSVKRKGSFYQMQKAALCCVLNAVEMSQIVWLHQQELGELRHFVTKLLSMKRKKLWKQSGRFMGEIGFRWFARFPAKPRHLLPQVLALVSAYATNLLGLIEKELH